MQEVPVAAVWGLAVEMLGVLGGSISLCLMVDRGWLPLRSYMLCNCQFCQRQPIGGGYPFPFYCLCTPVDASGHA